MERPAWGQSLQEVPMVGTAVVRPPGGGWPGGCSLKEDFTRLAGGGEFCLRAPWLGRGGSHYGRSSPREPMSLAEVWGL